MNFQSNTSVQSANILHQQVAQPRKRGRKCTKLQELQYVLNEIQLSKHLLCQFLSQKWNSKALQSDKQLLHLKDMKQEYLIKLHQNISHKIKDRKKFKVNWSQNQLTLLNTLILLQSYDTNTKVESFQQKHWQGISVCLPGRTGQDCLFKHLSLSKKDVKTNKWSQQQDQILKKVVQNPQETDWTQVSKILFKEVTNKDKSYRSGKQCRQHYYCYLDPSLKKGAWSKAQDKKLINLFQQMGRKWFQMTKILKGRNENSIKNRFAILCKDLQEFSQDSLVEQIRITRVNKKYNSEKVKQKKQIKKPVQNKVGNKNKVVKKNSMQLIIEKQQKSNQEAQKIAAQNKLSGNKNKRKFCKRPQNIQQQDTYEINQEVQDKKISSLISALSLQENNDMFKSIVFSAQQLIFEEQINSFSNLRISSNNLLERQNDQGIFLNSNKRLSLSLLSLNYFNSSNNQIVS